MRYNYLNLSDQRKRKF